LSTGIYQFELKVTDAGGLFDKDTVQVTLNAQSIPPCDNSNRPVINAQLLPVGTLSQARSVIETEVNYSQSGSGTGANGQSYQWTPARINDPYFGVMFQTAAVEKSKGSAVINYNFVEITVEYSLP